MSIYILSFALVRQCLQLCRVDRDRSFTRYLWAVTGTLQCSRYLCRLHNIGCTRLLKQRTYREDSYNKRSRPAHRKQTPIQRKSCRLYRRLFHTRQHTHLETGIGAHLLLVFQTDKQRLVTQQMRRDMFLLEKQAQNTFLLQRCTALPVLLNQLFDVFTIHICLSR